jgi:hypothetical protein
MIFNPDNFESERSGENINARIATALFDPDVKMPDGIVDFAGVAAPKRFAVYRNNVTVSLIEALAAAYPSLRAIMGEENFCLVSRNYIVANPPVSPLMQQYGNNFAEFLEQFPPLRKSPFLGDVARVERAWLEVFHSADAPALDLSILEKTPAEDVPDLILVRHPASNLLNSRWPIGDLFQWRFERPKSGADLSCGQAVMITRQNHTVYVQTISRQAYEFLCALSESLTLGEAAEKAMATDPRFDISDVLGTALAGGLFMHADTASEKQK